MLHITEGWGPLQAVEISIALLYCIDFFYLQSDLGSDQLPQGNWRDTMLDGAIAVVFGAAYWQASDRKLFTCYTLLALAGALIVAYHVTPHRRFLSAILPHSILTILFMCLAWFARNLDHVTWAYAVMSWLPTTWYGTYVFWLANRFVPSKSCGTGYPIGDGAAADSPIGRRSPHCQYTPRRSWRTRLLFCLLCQWVPSILPCSETRYVMSVTLVQP